VLYELCTGRPAFRAPTTVAVIRRVCDEAPRPVRAVNPDVPEPLCRLIGRLHAKKPADRPASAQEVADVLARLLAGLQGQSPAVVLSETASRHAPRRVGLSPRWAWAAAALVLLLAGLGVSEATGVTEVRGAVIRLFSPQGTLVVEVDDPGVSVTVDGADVVITGAGAKQIRLKPGQYTVEASKDGKVVSRELVSVSRNGRQVVRVSKESVALSGAEAWEKSVAALPAEKQVEAVERRLRELNPEFQGKVDFSIGDGQVWRLGFPTDRVTDISPVRALKGLEWLYCGGSAGRKGRLSDLTPLRGLRLRRLNCACSQVSDLEPLRGMPLEHLHCEMTGVSSLSPLTGMKLVCLTIEGTSVSDLKPLRGMPLKWLDAAWVRGASDLKPLEGMPLEYLNVTELPASDLSPIADMKTLNTLILDSMPVTDLAPLRGLRPKELSIRGTRVTDLTPTKEMPLRSLRLDYRANHREFLRSFKGLEIINDKPVAEFWKELDGR
jgi:hypothetical protein